MRKSSCAVSLALIGSGLILAGCVGCTPPPTSGPRTSGHPGGYYGGPGYRGGGAGRSAPSGSPRGGFGRTGHAAGGS